MKTILPFIMSLALILIGCSRPTKNEEGDDEGNVNYPQGYYSKPGATKNQDATSKLAQLGQPKRRVAVLDFWNDTPIKSSDIGTFAADEIRRTLFTQSQLVTPIDAVTQFTTQDFIDGQRVKVDQLVREGRRQGVALLIVGRISKIIVRQKGDDVGLFRSQEARAAIDMEIKVFDVNGGREISAYGRSGEATNNQIVALDKEDLNSPEFRNELIKLAVRDASDKLAPFVIQSVQKMDWEGRVAKVTGNKIYINSGRNSGIVIGDILRVITNGDDVYDPETGSYLGRTKGELKGTLEITDFIGEDASVASIHTGANFRPGDSVRLY